MLFIPFKIYSCTTGTLLSEAFRPEGGSCRRNGNVFRIRAFNCAKSHLSSGRFLVLFLFFMEHSCVPKSNAFEINSSFFFLIFVKREPFGWIIFKRLLYYALCLSLQNVLTYRTSIVSHSERDFRHFSLAHCRTSRNTLFFFSHLCLHTMSYKHLAISPRGPLVCDGKVDPQDLRMPRTFLNIYDFLNR